MRKTLVLVLAAVLLLPLAASAQNGRTSLDAVAKAMGTANLKSFEMTGNGMSYAVGQSTAPGAPWPRFHVKSWKRTLNYETASMRDQIVQVRVADPPRGGGIFVRGDQKLDQSLSGEHAWNTTGDTFIPFGRSLTERQFQLWATPHGVLKAAMAHKGTVEGRTITVAVAGRFKLKATVNAKNLVEKVEGLVADPVVGDQLVEISYSAYDDFGGVMFPRVIQQTSGGFPSLTLTVDGLKPNAPANIAVPDQVRQATPGYYAKVTVEKPADGVWYLTGTSHHSVVIEMKDHLIVVEAPLGEERAMAVLAETRKLVPAKPIRYVVNSHHHYDHSGGLRTFASEGITVVTSQVSREFFEWALHAPATAGPDRQAKARRKVTVEGVADKRVMTDGARTLEIYHIAENLHCDGMLLVYLPKEKFLIQADAFTPVAPTAKYPVPPNPFSVNLHENIQRLKLDVAQMLPLHGRMVPLGELHKAIGLAK